MKLHPLYDQVYYTIEYCYTPSKSRDYEKHYHYWRIKAYEILDNSLSVTGFAPLPKKFTIEDAIMLYATLNAPLIKEGGSNVKKKNAYQV